MVRPMSLVLIFVCGKKLTELKYSSNCKLNESTTACCNLSDQMLKITPMYIGTANDEIIKACCGDVRPSNSSQACFYTHYSNINLLHGIKMKYVCNKILARNLQLYNCMACRQPDGIIGVS